MKLDSIARSLAGTLAGATFVLACACHTGAVSTPPNNQPPVGQTGQTAQTGGGSLLAADGKHFAATRLYQGECMPAGSRGGCYSVTLNADGSYRNMLLDAAIIGTYEIDGDTVRLTPAGDAPPSTMTLSADRTKLDDYVYQPAIEP